MNSFKCDVLVSKTTAYKGSKDNSLQAVELSGHQTCKLLSSHLFKPFPRRFPDPSQFSAAKLTHYSTMPTNPRTPHDLGNASCSEVMCTKTLAMLPSIHVRVYKQWHKSWSELYVQSLFWLRPFEVF